MSESLNKDSEMEAVIDGEVVEKPPHDLTDSEGSEEGITPKPSPSISKAIEPDARLKGSKPYFQYVYLPLIFLTVALLGGFRVGADGSFVFLVPALICLVFAVLLLLLFFRSGLLQLDGWFSEDFSSLRNFANGAVVFTLFWAAVQVFNSLIPEQGLPFWVVAFCFFWTLWNNLFSDFSTKTLLTSLGGLFAFAFVAKYIVLLNLVSNEGGSWLERLWQNPSKEAVTYFLDLPRFSGATGYVQFFTVILFLVGLFFLSPRSTEES